MNLQESVERIQDAGTMLTDRFYEILFEKYPEVVPLFHGVSIHAQSIMLTKALNSCKSYPKLRNSNETYLQELGTRHKEKDVPKEFYPKFIDAMLMALEKFHGEDWDEALAEQWSAALNHASEIMFLGYEHDTR